MKTAMVVLFAVIFLALGAYPAFGDIGIIVRVVSLKAQTICEDNVYSEKVFFEDGKAIWQLYGSSYLAFYSEEALKNLVQSDSVKVFLAPLEEGAAPSFGNLYLVLKDYLRDEAYGLDPETFYVWPVKFSTPGTKSKDSEGVVYYKGIAPFGDMAISNIKKNGGWITKDSFAPSKARR